MTKAKIKKLYDLINQVTIIDDDQFKFEYEDEFVKITHTNCDFCTPWRIVGADIIIDDFSYSFGFDDYPVFKLTFFNKRLKNLLESLNINLNINNFDLFDDAVYKKVNVLNRQRESIVEDELYDFRICNVIKKNKLVPFEDFYKQFNLALNTPPKPPEPKIKLNGEYTKEELLKLLK